MSQNCMILYPNRADPPVGSRAGATLSGPTWQMPITNLQNRRATSPARSVNTAPANTKFDVRISRQIQIRAVVLIRHNFTPTAYWRVTAWYDEGSKSSYSDPAYTSTQDVYASLFYTEDLPWESENWWDGKPLSEDIDGYAQNAILVLPEFVDAQNWRIELFDEGNPAGYLEVSRLFMADGWQPSVNYSYGATLSNETKTQVEETRSGAEYFDRREPFRVANFGFDYLPEEEALLRGLELSRKAGIDSEVFLIMDPNNPRIVTQTSFLGRLRRLSEWEQAIFKRANISFEIKEII